MKTEMSKQEARKITIIEELLAGRFTNKQAAQLLDLSVRQVQRMKAEASNNGVMSILHKNRGRKPANALDPDVAWLFLCQSSIGTSVSSTSSQNSSTLILGSNSRKGSTDSHVSSTGCRMILR
jgi:hypothetical protein